MSASTTLLEREEELATIERVLGAAADGGGGLLAIEGDAGVGKTTLLQAASRGGAEREMLVLRARGGEYERDFPYGVIRQLFEPLFAEKGRREELLSGDAAPAAPVFEPAVAPAAGADPFAVQHGLHWLVTALAASVPLLMLVDDAQWADLASLRVLTYVGRRLEELPAVLALTVRRGEPGEHDALLDELRREPSAQAIEPSALSAAAAAALVEGEFGRQPSERFAHACCDATGGNPFLLVELLRAIGPAEMGRTEADAARLAEVAAAGTSRSILARLARLGDHSIATARAVAVLEPNAEVRLIAALTTLSSEAVAEASERLVMARLLTDSQPLAFIHPLVREAVLSDVPAPRRAADHARAGRLLSDNGADADTVAAQLLLAEPRGDGWAVDTLRDAATEALGRGAPEAAVSYLRRALREPPPKQDRLEVSRELGAALLRADEPEGIEVLRAVRTSLDDPVARAEIAVELSASLALRRPGGEGVALLEESLGELREQRSGLGLQLRGHVINEVIAGLEGVPESILPEPGEALAAETFDGRLFLTNVAFLYALGLGPMDRVKGLADWVVSDRAAAEAAALAGWPPELALMTLTLADREYPDDLFELMINASRRRGTSPGVAAGFGVRAICRYTGGELREAWADANTALRLVRPTGIRVGLANWLSVALRTLVALGELATAQDLLDEVWCGREPGPGIPGAILLVSRGELRAASDRHAEGRHDFLAASERVRWLPYSNPEILGWRTGLAQAEAALGNGEEAQRLAGEAVALARKAGGRRGIGITLRVQGAVTDGRQGIELLSEASEVLAGTRARLEYAYALADLGAALRRANRRKEARGPLREALDLANRFGAVTLEERVRTELAATGARPRKAALAGVESLTPSELRVARMAAEGMTNAEIAQTLVVSPKTVETHLRHVFQKLDIERRTELADRLAAA